MVNDKLNPKIWENDTLKEDVKQALLRVVEQFKEEFIDFDDDTEIEIKTVKKTTPVKAKITSVKKSEDNEEDYYMTCPECGEKALLKTEGCVSCMKCGWSKCG